MKLYKLTDQNWETQNNTKWGLNVTHTAKGNSNKLCSDGVIHAYEDPRLAIIMNPVHADYKNPILWEAEGDIIISDGTKCGCKSLTTLDIIKIPEMDIVNIIAFGIYCALEVYQESTFVNWANNWLNNIDRSSNAAYAATNATTNAAIVAAHAAYAATNATTNAAIVAAHAAKAAANAAYAATYKINFISIINKAMRIK